MEGWEWSIDAGVAETCRIYRVRRQHARVGPDVLLDIGDDFRAVQREARTQLILIAPAITSEPGRFGRLHKIHAEDKLILIDRPAHGLDAIVRDLRCGDIGRRQKRQQLLGDWFDPVFGDDGAWKLRGWHRAIVVFHARQWIVDQVRDPAEVATLHGRGRKTVQRLDAPALPEGLVVAHEE